MVKKKRKPSVLLGMITFVLISIATWTVISNTQDIITQYISPMYQIVISLFILVLAAYTGYRTFK